MKKLALIHTAFAMAAMAAASVSHADVVDFSGSMTGRPSVIPFAACAPLPFQGTITGASGTSSSFGDFTYSHTVCTAGQTGAVHGTFLIDFGVDQFEGTVDGSATATGTPSLFDLLFTYTITDGTGRFLDATGSFTGSGTVDTSNPPPHISLSFAAVPEAGTWAMMLVGFGAIGCALRRRPGIGGPVPQIA